MTIGRTLPRNGIRAAPVGAPVAVSAPVLGPELLADPSLDNLNGEWLALGAGSGTSTISGGQWTVTNGGSTRNAPRIQLQPPFIENLKAALVTGATYRVTVVTTATNNAPIGCTIIDSTGNSFIPAGSPAGTYSADQVSDGNSSGNIFAFTGNANVNGAITSVSIRRVS